jgi:hypothetical protein
MQGVEEGQKAAGARRVYMSMCLYTVVCPWVDQKRMVSDLVGIRAIRSEGLPAFSSALLPFPTTARGRQHGPRIVAVRQTGR